MINIRQIENFLIDPKGTQHVDLENEIKDFPYCMLLHYVDCKANNQKNLFHLALLMPSRKRLHDLFVEKDNNIVEPKKKLPVQEEVVQAQIIAVTTEECIEKQVVEETIVVKTQTTTQITTEDDSPMAILQRRLAELAQGNSASISSEKTACKTIVETQTEVEEVAEFSSTSTTSVDELIEKFNTMPSKRSYFSEDLDDDFSLKDLAKSSLMERTNIVSETLAELYVSQNLYDKALKIYEALVAKYPEKNAIFAYRIQELKTLKDKNK